MDELEPARTSRPSFDEETLRRVQARVPEALELFFEHYFDRVYDYVLRMLRDPVQADDVTQNAFVRLSAVLDQLDPTRDPSGWVFAVVTNVVRDHWRAQKRGVRKLEVEFEEAWASPPASESEGADEKVEREERAQLIQRALDQLSPADREIVLLRSYEDLDTAEVAATLGIQADAVRQRHSRAVRRLGKIYRQLTREERLSS